MKNHLVILAGFLLIASPSYGATLGTSASATDPQRSGEAGTGLFTPSSGAVAVSSSGTEMLRVNSTGVGIGTTSPQAQLDVLSTSSSLDRGISSYQYGSNNFSAYFNLFKARGSAAAPSAVSNNDYVGGQTFYGFDGTNFLLSAGFGGRVNGTVSTGSVPQDLFFYTSGGASDSDPYTNGHVRMVISSGGNVGIGTTSPSYKLDLQNSNGASQLHLSGTGADSGLYLEGFGADIGNVMLGMSFDGSNYVAKATSANQINFNGGVTYFSNATGLTVGNTMSPINIVSIGTTGIAVGNSYAGDTTPTNGAIIQGNVGVGTISPQATLDVNGFVRLALNSSAPATCSSSNEGALALSHLAQVCVCDTTPAWHILNTSTACSW